MALSRYSVLDAYVLEELRREYDSQNPRGRIRLLKSLQKNDTGPPFEIMKMAAQDPNVSVRQWLARYGVFQVEIERATSDGVRDWMEKKRQAGNVLVEIVKSDSDPFVRACLRENPSVFSEIDSLRFWKPHFLDASHMERLALMRNPEVGTTLVEKVFDPEETELGIDMQSRRELCHAFLRNDAKLHKLRDDAGICPDHYGYWEARFDAEKFLDTLWKLALKWPDSSDIPAIIFSEIPVGRASKVKAEVYRECERLRVCILFNCERRTQDDEVVQLGVQDPDDSCRERAFAILGYVPPGLVEDLIKRKDKVALEGLAQNESLSVENLKKIQKCLDEIKPSGFPRTWNTIERKQKATVSQDAERLFGKDGRGLLEEKIDFIGKTLAGIASTNESLTGKIGSALLWARIAGAVSALIFLFLILK